VGLRDPAAGQHHHTSWSRRTREAAASSFRAHRNDFAPQDFSSKVLVAAYGGISALPLPACSSPTARTTVAAIIESPPDFLWRQSQTDQVTGQLW